MSVKLMSAIFETEFFDLPMPDPDKDGKPRRAKASSMKLVLLALADHANDEGESSYPGFSKLEVKTGLSRQGLSDVLSALKYNGLVFVGEKPSKLGTNNYSLNLTAYPKLSGDDGIRLLVKSLDQSSHLTSASQVTLPEVVKSLDLKHPLTINEPSLHTDEKKDTYEIKGIEASIRQGRKTTDEDINPAKFEHDALVAFEEAFKITNGNIAWYNTKYKPLREFLVKCYADKDAFKKYRIWYNDKGQFRGGMNAVQIKRSPADFLVSWDAFMADNQPAENTREEGKSFYV